MTGTYYLHDLALLPKARGLGAAGDIVGIALAQATVAGFRTASLVAVNNSQPFWQRQGFDVAMHRASRKARGLRARRAIHDAGRVVR